MTRRVVVRMTPYARTLCGLATGAVFAGAGNPDVVIGPFQQVSGADCAFLSAAVIRFSKSSGSGMAGPFDVL